MRLRNDSAPRPPTRVQKARVVVPPYVRANGDHVSGYTYEVGDIVEGNAGTKYAGQMGHVTGGTALGRKVAVHFHQGHGTGGSHAKVYPHEISVAARQAPGTVPDADRPGSNAPVPHFASGDFNRMPSRPRSDVIVAQMSPAEREADLAHLREFAARGPQYRVSRARMAEHEKYTEPGEASDDQAVSSGMASRIASQNAQMTGPKKPPSHPSYQQEVAERNTGPLEEDFPGLLGPSDAPAAMPPIHGGGSGGRSPAAIREELKELDEAARGSSPARAHALAVRTRRLHHDLQVATGQLRVAYAKALLASRRGIPK